MNGMPVQTAKGAMYSAEGGLASTAELLIAGGDERLRLDVGTGRNRYQCRPFPEPDLLAFGSSTASVISDAGFAAADNLRVRMIEELERRPEAEVLAVHVARMRRELLALCGFGGDSGIEVLFAGSGTDLHRIATRMAGGGRPGHLRAIVVDVAETGSGVPEALRGRRYPAPLADRGVSDADGGAEVVHVSVRLADGRPRPAEQIDARVTALTDEAVAEGRAVLLVLVDVSKTGLVAPSPACAMALSRRHGDALHVLVDACQFRLAPATLRVYLEQGFAVALTGSKFMSGPVFSGAMLVPDAPVWRRAPPVAVHPGLLLRWEAALHEMRAFAAVPDDDIAAFLRDLAAAVGRRLRASPCLAPLPGPVPNRGPISEGGWDRLPSIFPFLASHADGRLLSRDESRLLYRWLQTDMGDMPAFSGDAGERALATRRCQLGQPVACGQRHGQPVAALRLAASARMIVEATTDDRAAQVIERAVTALDKAEMLTLNFRRLSEGLDEDVDRRGSAIVHM